MQKMKAIQVSAPGDDFKVVTIAVPEPQQNWVGGTPEEALRFSVISGVRPMVEVFPLEQAALAFEKMMTAKVLFRAVLQMGGDSND